MAFRDTLRTLPYTPTTPNGRGFLGPVGRTAVHIGFLASAIADEDVTVTTEDALTELGHAREHWAARTISEAMSTAARERAETITTALDEAIAEYGDWTDEDRANNLRDFDQRIAQLWADLDREFLGLRDSDAGTSM